MTQPAKVQEPSMEEILASIRRIIADDEAKPAAAEKPASPPAAAKPAVMKDIPPSAIAPAPKPARRAEAGAACATAACTRTGRQQQPGRHRRDAGEPRCGDARGGHQAGAARARSRRVRTHRRDGIAGAGAAQRQHSTRSNRRTTSNSPKPRRHVASRPMSRRSRALRQHDQFYRIRPSPRSNPPSIRWPIPC